MGKSWLIPRDKWSGYAITVLLTILICLIVYSPFLFGEYLYIYSDIGSDTVSQFVPGYLKMVELIRDDGIPT